MMKLKNECHIEGYLYEHALEKKVSGEKSKNPGTEFISGTVSIATDEDILNIVPVHFTYVTALTASGKPNATFATLSNIIDGTYDKTKRDVSLFMRGSSNQRILYKGTDY